MLSTWWTLVGRSLPRTPCRKGPMSETRSRDNAGPLLRSPLKQILSAVATGGGARDDSASHLTSRCSICGPDEDCCRKRVSASIRRPTHVEK